MNEDIINKNERFDDMHVSADELSKLYERQSRRYDSDLNTEDDL